MQVNIEGCDLATGKVVSSYIGSKPPANTGKFTWNLTEQLRPGLHRYAWLVFEQARRDIDPPIVNDFTPRRSWNVNTFAKEFNLGHAHAGNFFTVRDNFFLTAVPCLRRATTPTASRAWSTSR